MNDHTRHVCNDILHTTGMRANFLPLWHELCYGKNDAKSGDSAVLGIGSGAHGTRRLGATASRISLDRAGLDRGCTKRSHGKTRDWTVTGTLGIVASDVLPTIGARPADDLPTLACQAVCSDSGRCAGGTVREFAAILPRLSETLLFASTGSMASRSVRL